MTPTIQGLDKFKRDGSDLFYKNMTEALKVTR